MPTNYLIQWIPGRPGNINKYDQSNQRAVRGGCVCGGGRKRVGPPRILRSFNEHIKQPVIIIPVVILVVVIVTTIHPVVGTTPHTVVEEDVSKQFHHLTYVHELRVVDFVVRIVRICCETFVRRRHLDVTG